MREFLLDVNKRSKKSLGGYFKDFFIKTSWIIELIVIFYIWILIFNNYTNLGGFTIREMIAYILMGSIISIITGGFLQGVVNRDLSDGMAVLMVVSPIRYLLKILSRDFLKIIFIFLLSMVLQFAVMYVFIGEFTVVFNAAYMAVIVCIILLSFIIELQFSYFFRLIAFWTFESSYIYKTILRIKKFFAGAYFPLTILPLSLLVVSYYLPFAYSFFVPTQLYLQKIPFYVGIRGIFIELAWIVLIYIFIHVIWRKKIKQKESQSLPPQSQQ